MDAFFVALNSMKTLIGSLLFMLSFSNCQERYFEFDYVAQTRGFYLSISIGNNVLSIVEQRGGKERELNLSEVQQNELTAIFNKIDFENVVLSNGSKSSYDAAPMATASFVVEESQYDYDFDHGYPPKELEAFISKILTLSQIVE